MTRINALCLIMLAMCNTSLLGQQHQRSSEVIAPFLQISPDARGMAMGNTGAAAKPNIFSMYYNPARYSFIEDKTTIGASLRHCSISYNLYDLSVAQKIGKISTLAASIRYCRYKKVYYHGGGNELLGTYIPKEYAIDLAYSIKIGKFISVALTGRYVNSALFKSMDYYELRNVKIAKSFAIDGGVFYTHDMSFKDFSGNYSFGLSLTNLGGKTGYVTEHSYYDDDFNWVVNHDDIDYIPTTIRIGSSADLSKDNYSFALSFDMSKIVVPEFSTYDINCGFGLEYGRIINDCSLFARTGYFNNPSIVGNINYYTIGLGINLYGFDLNIACNISTNKGKFYDYLMATIKYGFNY